jgi:hypothetical protein
MAEPVYRRGTKKYLGIDFDPNDYEALRQIAEEDGDRGVSSLVRSIVRSWLRSRNAGVPAAPSLSTILSLPPAGVATGSLSPTKFATDERHNAQQVHVLPPPPPAPFDWVPENPCVEELPDPTKPNEASDKSGEEN